MTNRAANFCDSLFRRRRPRLAVRLAGTLLASLGMISGPAAVVLAQTSALDVQTSQTITDASVDPIVVDETPTIDSLLDALALTQDADEADRLVRDIQRSWNESGSSSVDLLMRRAEIAMRQRRFPLALDLLDAVIITAPDFAEAWNRRATVHFMRDDYALSIADVQQVLRLEPRHFGALSGIGVMLDELGRYRHAAAFLKAALEVNPYLDGAKNRLDAIERRLQGAPI